MQTCDYLPVVTSPAPGARPPGTPGVRGGRGRLGGGGGAAPGWGAPPALGPGTPTAQHKVCGRYQRRKYLDSFQNTTFMKVNLEIKDVLW